MKVIENIQDWTQEIAKLLWSTRKIEGDTVVAAVSTKTKEPIHLLMRESELNQFDPSTLSLAVDYITNKDQLELAYKERDYLISKIPEISRYLDLTVMIEDYEEELREF